MAKAKLTQEQWQRLGEEWCADVSVNSLSKKYGASRKAIDNSARRFGWVKDPILQEAIAAATRGKAQVMRHATDTSTRDATVDRIAGDRASLIMAHQSAWDGIYELRQDAFRMLRGEPTRLVAKPLEHDVQDEAGRIIERKAVMTLTKRINLAHKLMAIFETDARAMMTAQEGERRAWGFDYKTQQEGNTVNEAELRRRNELIDSLRTMGGKLAELQALQAAMSGAQTAQPRPLSQPPTIEGEVA